MTDSLAPSIRKQLWFTVHGSWFMINGSGFMVNGSWTSQATKSITWLCLIQRYTID